MTSGCENVLTRANSDAAPSNGAAVEEDAASPDVRRRIEPEDYRKARILILDDQKPMVTLLHQILVQDQYSFIQTTSDPFTALRMAEEFSPDVMLVDVNMPQMTGFEFVAKVFQMGRQPAVLFVTGNNDEKARGEAFAVGAADFVAKPVKPFELLMRVRNQAQKVMMERAILQQNLTLQFDLAERDKKLIAAKTVLRQAESRLNAQPPRVPQSIADAPEMAPSPAITVPELDFVARISHELRTPLNVVSGYSQMIMSEMLGPLGNDAYREYIQHIDAGASHMARIVDDLQDYAKAEHGKLQLTITAVDVGVSVREAVELLGQTAKTAKVSLRVEIDPAIGTMHTDEGRLRQILFNLVGNAIKFTPSGGRVTVRADRESEKDILILAISDSGIGIPPEDIPIVMRPFQRGSNPLVKGRTGTGLGLPLTEKLAQALGGTLEIRSKVGVGTCVIIRLPDQTPRDR